MPYDIALPQKRIEVISPNKISATQGKVWWQEGFESNVLKFSAGAIANTATFIRTGAYALSVTSAGAGPWITAPATKVIGLTEAFTNTKVGVEFYMLTTKVTTAAGGVASAGLDYFKIVDGTTENRIGVQILFGAAAADAKLQYVDSANAWADVPGGSLIGADGYYHRIKIVCNPVTKEYLYIEYDNKRYDMAGIAFRSVAALLSYQTYLKFEVTGIDATTADMWIDDITITTDEP